MRITSKGQVTIPIAVKEKVGLLPEAEVGFDFDGETVRISRLENGRRECRGERTVRRLRGRATVPMWTDEIMRLTRGE